MSAPTAPDPSQLVLRYLNRLSTTCSATTCGAIPLAAVYLQRFGASESDVRARRFDIDLVLLSNASAPTSNPPLSFRLVLTAYQDNRAWIAVTVRCCLGTFTALFLVHFLRALNAHLNHRFPDAVQTKSLYFRVWGHMSLERHLMAILLLVLVVQHNPIMLIWTLPWFGPSSHSYIVFRNAWETVVYVVILGSLLIMLDCYRKDCHEFSNGASLKVAGYWFLGVKVALFAGAVVLRLSLALSLEGLFDATVNVAQWVSVVDLLLLVAGFSVFFGVVAIVHRELEAQRYSHTRYLSLSFRYLTVIAFAILAILLLNTAFSSTYAPVSTTTSTDLTAAALVVEIATAVFVFFAVLAFYPPNKLEPGLIPRGYVIRERRQYPTLPPQATTQPVEALSRATATLLRLPAFRAKACTKPHRLFCLETACLLMNCSRHAYYRSSLNLPNDTSEDGVVAYPATSYVNQTALLRDGLEETMAIHDDGTDTNCLILHSEFRIIFAFRGTDSKANIKTDFEIKLEPFPWLPPESDGSQTPFVHRGFLTAYATVRDKCHAALRDLLRRYDGQGHASDSVQIYCTGVVGIAYAVVMTKVVLGHSLGGALATLAALDLKLSFKRDVVMYNYGSPRIVEVRKKPGRHYLKGYTENLDMILERCLQSERHHVGDFYMQNALEDALYDDSMDERSPPKTPMPHPKEVHKAYMELLRWRGLEPDACEYLCRAETSESQWVHVCLVEFNTTRGHAVLQVLWHLCHFQSTLVCLAQAESHGCLLSLCLCLTVRPDTLKLRAVRILNLVSLASPQGNVAVVKALQALDSITLVVNVIADMIHETSPPTLLDEVFRLVKMLLLLEDDPWLRRVLTESETCTTLVDFHACREGVATVQLHAAECRDLMKTPTTMVYTLHQLMARAKLANTEDVLVQIAHKLIEMTSRDAAAWQAVVDHLTAPPFTPPIETTADAATKPPPTPPPSTHPTIRSAELIAVEDHPKYAKYFKMLQVRVPEDLVRQRMIADSVDDRILDSPHLVVSAVDGYSDTEPSPPMSLPPTPCHVSMASNPQGENHAQEDGGNTTLCTRHGVLSDIHCTQVLSVLAKLPWPLAHLGHVIQSGDESTLTSKIVDKLLVLLAIPSTLEKDAIQNILQGTHSSTCRDAERAVAVVLALAELIKCWQIYWQFPVTLHDFQAKCSLIHDTCNELIHSAGLLEIVQIACNLEKATAFEWRFLAMDDANYPGLIELVHAVQELAPHLVRIGKSLEHLPKAVDINYDDMHVVLAAQEAKLNTVVAQLPTLSKHPWAAFVESASTELDKCKINLETACVLLGDTASRLFGRSGAVPTSKLFTVVHRVSTTLAEADSNG
ncbi:hypothetical protein DYB32_003316 [Aphanomyces invadans]|uniref:Fungal lipase-type domain-containing protein n=1 Tax=Aphanomyces invadans TaxID=157072 RepID=A0A418B107_9STRA|nr:hypothetical protein DYB32_003316 [Aphanomyces invadans]